jgi:hypothetical protein
LGLGLGGWKGGFCFQAIFGVESGLSSVHSETGLLMQVLLGVRGEDLVGGGKTEDFFFSFPLFLMCSCDVPSKFLTGSPNVPQVHNVFPNMFFV